MKTRHTLNKILWMENLHLKNTLEIWIRRCLSRCKSRTHYFMSACICLLSNWKVNEREEKIHKKFKSRWKWNFVKFFFPFELLLLALPFHLLMHYSWDFNKRRRRKSLGKFVLELVSRRDINLLVDFMSVRALQKVHFVKFNCGWWWH